jgi:hypothetical protein
MAQTEEASELRERSASSAANTFRHVVRGWGSGRFVPATRAQQFLGASHRPWQGVTLGYFSNAFRFSAPREDTALAGSGDGGKKSGKTTTPWRKADEKAPVALARGSLSSIRDVREAGKWSVLRNGSYTHRHKARLRCPSLPAPELRISPATSSIFYVSPLCLDAGQDSPNESPVPGRARAGYISSNPAPRPNAPTVCRSRASLQEHNAFGGSVPTNCLKLRINGAGRLQSEESQRSLRGKGPPHHPFSRHGETR